MDVLIPGWAEQGTDDSQDKGYEVRDVLPASAKVGQSMGIKFGVVARPTGPRRPNRHRQVRAARA